MRRFEAPWDNALKISTAASAALVLAVAGVLAAVFGSLPELPAPVAAIAPAAVVAILAVTWALAPRAFALHGRDLLVERRLAGPIRIPLAEVREVAVLAPGALQGAVKLVGAAGFCGHYGRFRTRALGAFRLYATRREGLVAVRLEQERFVLSPAHPEEFATTLLAAAPGARRAPPEALAPVPGSGRRTVVLLAGLVAVLGLVVAGVGGFAWAHAPTSIAVAGEAIVIARRAAGPVELPLAAVRSVELLPRERLAGLSRTAGTAGFGALYGRFSTPALGGFQLYALQGRRSWVLLVVEGEPAGLGGPVVVTPDEPEAFLASVRAALAARGSPAPER